VEKMKIWGNPMIKELLQVVLFGQGAKADARSIQEVRKTKSIPISAIILSVTVVCPFSLLPYVFTHYSID
jgi:P2-related tail formation protein